MEAFDCGLDAHSVICKANLLAGTRIALWDFVCYMFCSNSFLDLISVCLEACANWQMPFVVSFPVPKIPFFRLRRLEHHIRRLDMARSSFTYSVLLDENSYTSKICSLLMILCSSQPYRFPFQYRFRVYTPSKYFPGEQWRTPKGLMVFALSQSQLVNVRDSRPLAFLIEPR